MAFLHCLRDVFYEYAALSWCLINNEYAHKQKKKLKLNVYSWRITDDLL